jgi:hypothetical protein
MITGLPSKVRYEVSLRVLEFGQYTCRNAIVETL